MSDYFADTVQCMLGINSVCTMNGKLRVGPRCAKCGFNQSVYERRIKRIRQSGLLYNADKAIGKD